MYIGTQEGTPADVTEVGLTGRPSPAQSQQEGRVVICIDGSIDCLRMRGENGVPRHFLFGMWGSPEVSVCSGHYYLVWEIREFTDSNLIDLTNAARLQLGDGLNGEVCICDLPTDATVLLEGQGAKYSTYSEFRSAVGIFPSSSKRDRNKLLRTSMARGKYLGDSLADMPGTSIGKKLRTFFIDEKTALAFVNAERGKPVRAGEAFPSLISPGHSANIWRQNPDEDVPYLYCDCYDMMSSQDDAKRNSRKWFTITEVYRRFAWHLHEKDSRRIPPMSRSFWNLWTVDYLRKYCAIQIAPFDGVDFPIELQDLRNEALWRLCEKVYCFFRYAWTARRILAGSIGERHEEMPFSRRFVREFTFLVDQQIRTALSVLTSFGAIEIVKRDPDTVKDGVHFHGTHYYRFGPLVNYTPK